jgi:hypothetical protein
MSIPRRRFLQLATAAGGLAALPRAARAQSYPTRPVRIIVATSAGGSTDIAARVIGQWLTERLGQSFVVENRPGGGNNIGTEAAVRAPADGYTLLMANTVNAINTTLYDNLGYNFVTDMAPVAILMRTALLMQVHPSVPAKTAAEFIDYARANPGKINMGSGGNGATGHVSGELFKMMAGVQMVHVPDRRPGAGRVHHHRLVDPVHQSRPAARAGGHHDHAVGCPAGGAAAGGCRAGLRGERLERHVRAEGHAGRDHREAQPGNQRGPRRRQDQGSVHRHGRAAGHGLAGRVRKDHCRRYREVGEGDQVLGRQAELIGRGAGRLICDLSPVTPIWRLNHRLPSSD